MTRLECTTGGHNKFYEFHLLSAKNRFTVKGLYGAIGQAPKETTIYDGADEKEALSAMKKKQLEKQKKGYLVVSQNGSTIPLPDSVQKKTLTAP